MNDMLKMIQIIKKKIEMTIIIVISLIILYLISTNFNYVIQIYNQNNLNLSILEVFGGLFGLLLTSYAILFGLIPALTKDVLKTEAFGSINFRFFLALIINLLIIVISLIIPFISNLDKNILIVLQLVLISFIIQIFGLLIFYLFILFIISKKKALN